MGRRLLVVTTAAPDEERLAAELRELVGDGETTVRILAPAARLSWLGWLTNDEDDARAAAAETADRTAEALGPGVSIEIDRAGQDSDAVQAIADALRDFPADELIVLTRSSEESSWLEDETVSASFERFGVPVRHVELPDAG